MIKTARSKLLRSNGNINSRNTSYTVVILLHNCIQKGLYWALWSRYNHLIWQLIDITPLPERKNADRSEWKKATESPFNACTNQMEKKPKPKPKPKPWTCARSSVSVHERTSFTDYCVLMAIVVLIAKLPYFLMVFRFLIFSDSMKCSKPKKLPTQLLR